MMEILDTKNLKRKKVLVYPCGTEIGLEIYRAVHDSIHYELYGGSSTYDHGRFIYNKHIDNLPFITDQSIKSEIEEFNKAIGQYEFDFIYPAMDGVLTVFSKFREYLSPIIIAPDYKTAVITRSKSRTYSLLSGKIQVPYIYRDEKDICEYPVFLKPDVGQGAKGTKIIYNQSELQMLGSWGTGNLLLEYLPGTEFTVDCFTNAEGTLLYAKGRERRRIKDGISVNTVFVDNAQFLEIAHMINSAIRQKGGWFFQLKEAKDGNLKLLEVASRIAGTSGVSRNIGVNLPLLTLDVFSGYQIDFVMPNDYQIEMDRALYNRFKIDLMYEKIYVDYDDTIVIDGRVNLQMVQFLYQCVNNGKEIILLTKHNGNLESALEHYHLNSLFNRIFHLSADEKKCDYIDPHNAIFIDDSFGERKIVKDIFDIPTFDVHMIECLLEG